MIFSTVVLTLVSVASAVQQSLGFCGSEWRNWFPEQPVIVAAEAPVPPAAPVTPALSPVLTVALERGSGSAVSLLEHTVVHNSTSVKELKKHLDFKKKSNIFSPQHYNSRKKLTLPPPPPSASSKSEGSPLQRPENAGKKPEERKDLVRPNRPAVRVDSS